VYFSSVGRKCKLQFSDQQVHNRMCVAETAILFIPTGYVRDPETGSIDNIADEFSQCLKIFYKIETIQESIYFVNVRTLLRTDTV